jgi:cytochrome c556
MRRQVTRRQVQMFLTMCAGVMVWTMAGRAQQTAPAPAAQLIPVAVNSLLTQPDLYIGQTVSLYGPVEQVLSATTFSMDQNAKQASMTDLFIVAPTLQASPKAGAYVTVVGAVLRMDTAELTRRARNYTLDVPTTVAERYRGKVMVLATSVVDGALVDLAKAPPVPVTPEEEAFDRVMKRINPASAELRKGADGSDVALVTKNTAVLSAAFGETKKFFEGRKNAEAVGWATQAVALMATIEKGAAAGQWSDVKTAATTLTGLCQSCHAAFRERQEDGSYRVKK